MTGASKFNSKLGCHRGTAMHCVKNENLVNCCTTVGKTSHFKRLAVGVWPWKSLKVIGNGAVL